MAIGVACSGVVIVCFCFITFICSLAFFSLGIIALTTVLPYFQLDTVIESAQPPEFTTQLWTLIIISGICSLLAVIFACCSVRLKQCGIACVALILVSAMIGDQVMITQMYYGRGEALQQIQNNMNNSLPLYNNNTDVKHFWNDLQTTLECCGVQGPSDWAAVYGNTTTLPASCCQHDKNCSVDSSDIWDGSCKEHVAQQLHEKMIAMFSMTLIISIIESVAALACLFVCCCYTARVIIS